MQYRQPQQQAIFRLRTGHFCLRANIHRLDLQHTSNCPCETGPQNSLAAFPPVFLGLHRQLAEDHQFYHLHSTRHPSSKSYILECSRIRREHKSSVSSKMKHFIWHYLFCHVAKSLSVLCVKRPMVMNKLTCLYLQQKTANVIHIHKRYLDL